MTDYILLIPNVEAEWEAMSEADHQAVFDQHRAFQEALATRGAVVTGAEHVLELRGCLSGS